MLYQFQHPGGERATDTLWDIWEGLETGASHGDSTGLSTDGNWMLRHRRASLVLSVLCTLSHIDAGCMDGWMGGWVDGWVGGWMMD